MAEGIRKDALIEQTQGEARPVVSLSKESEEFEETCDLIFMEEFWHADAKLTSYTLSILLTLRTFCFLMKCRWVSLMSKKNRGKIKVVVMDKATNRYSFYVPSC